MASGLSARAWRALALVGAGVIVVLGLAFAYLGRSSASPSPAPAQTVPGQRTPSILQLASFGDADHGAVVMSSGTNADTYLTADGGKTWSQRHLGISATTFLDPKHAFAVTLVPSLRLDATADAGRSWAHRSVPVSVVRFGLHLNYAVGGPDFVDPAHGWWLDAAQRPGGPALWRTADGGRTWRPLPAAGLPTDMQLEQPAFADQLAGAIVAGPPAGGWPSLLATEDGGATWRSVPLPPAPADSFAGGGAFLPAMLALDGRLVLSVAMGTAAGGAARWSTVSEDGGLTWSRWSRQAGATMSLGVPAADDRGRLLLADGGRLWASDDQGRTWQGAPLNLPLNTQAVATVTARTGVLVIAALRQRSATAREVTLFRSPDGGARWTEVHLPHRADVALS